MKTTMFWLLGSLLAPVGWAAHCDEATSTSDAPQPHRYQLETVIQTEGGLYTVAAKTDLLLSEAHYGGAHIAGEGHVHLYVNGRLIGPIVNEKPLYLPPLSPGDNTIRLVLATNGHDESVYAVSSEATVALPAQ
ncbi:hypothetical protein [Chitinolyticbacter albus]|uniref:hypothetical protein n=1 Tax=Chitinolyticbacter albus TaxID=2961951 RepID=UPI00210B0595|nr:hypothetical protein [Chitinolyticbacter albus]